MSIFWSYPVTCLRKFVILFFVPKYNAFDVKDRQREDHEQSHIAWLRNTKFDPWILLFLFFNVRLKFKIMIFQVDKRVVWLLQKLPSTNPIYYSWMNHLTIW